MPWVQRSSGGNNWLCQLCRTQTIIGTVPINVCCWRTYVAYAVDVHVSSLLDTMLPEQLVHGTNVEVLRTKLTQRLIASVSMHPLFKDKLIVDVIPERHRPYHEQLAQVVVTHGEAKIASGVSGQRTGHEGSRRGTPTTGRTTRTVLPHDHAADHAQDDVLRTEAVEEKNRDPQSTVTGRTPSPIPLQNFTPNTPEGREILQRFLRGPDRTE